MLIPFLFELDATDFTLGNRLHLCLDTLQRFGALRFQNVSKLDLRVFLFANQGFCGAFGFLNDGVSR